MSFDNAVSEQNGLRFEISEEHTRRVHQDRIRFVRQNPVTLVLFHNRVNSNLSFLSGIYIHQKEHQAIPFQTVQVPYPN